jgi:probable F420-dependent oxidoreductase
MQVGAVFPQTEIGDDPQAIADYAKGVEAFGYRHLLAYDHVLGADPAAHAGWRGPYDIDTTFHEPLVLFGYLAALTSLELVTGVVILPQRQTALVAKQAAQVDILARGRFRLGVGVGWNAVEYEALGQDFSTRGAREEEQVALLRELWTNRAVTFDGRFDHVTGAGLSPLPVQRPIPVWLGGSSAPAYRRIGRIADGWFPQVPPDHRLDEARDLVAEGAAHAGRDLSAIGMEGRVSWRDGVEQVADHLDRWRRAGATHVSINTMGAGLGSVDGHLAALESIATVAALRA